MSNQERFFEALMENRVSLVPDNEQAEGFIVWVTPKRDYWEHEVKHHKDSIVRMGGYKVIQNWVKEGKPPSDDNTILLYQSHLKQLEVANYELANL
jgi:hypothetical protein